MKSKILLFLLLFIYGSLLSQETYSFYLKAPNKDNIPIVTHSRNGYRKEYSKTKNNSLDKLLNSYKVFSCKKVFKNSKKSSLQNIYLIECNDSTLINQLKTKYKQFYTLIENAQGETLGSHIPNDYSTNGTYTGNQIELDYIRATEAWDISKGSSNIKIGIADTNFNPDHEDLLNTLSIEVNPNSNNVNGDIHGTRVSSFAAANTNNNGIGLSSIGYNSYIFAGVGLNMSTLDELSRLQGVKVVNASWLILGTTSTDGTLNQTASIYKDVIDDIVNENKVVVIASAGNGETNPGNPNSYVFPASYKDVISVSSIGHRNATWWNTYESFLDGHEYLYNNQIRSHQHNDSVDIVAPGYGMHSVNPWTSGVSYNFGQTGTSYAGPIVAGTVALMFDINYCIDPKEVETILKLTAVKIDTLPQNLLYYGKLGAGKLDAYEAVKMTKDMADTYGTVEVKDRILYRPWFYKLETAPYEIKMTNNDVTGGSKLKFKARNNIEILSGDYYPDTGGYIDLSIDSNLDLDCPPPSSSGSVTTTQERNTLGISKSRLLVFPNPTVGILNIINEEDLSEITITDITGKTVYYMRDINRKELQINTVNFNSGVYFMKTKMKSGEIISTKIIKD